jgi:hypothetical protein
MEHYVSNDLTHMMRCGTPTAFSTTCVRCHHDLLRGSDDVCFWDGAKLGVNRAGLIGGSNS